MYKSIKIHKNEMSWATQFNYFGRDFSQSANLFIKITFNYLK